MLNKIVHTKQLYIISWDNIVASYLVLDEYMAWINILFKSTPASDLIMLLGVSSKINFKRYVLFPMILKPCIICLQTAFVICWKRPKELWLVERSDTEKLHGPSGSIPSWE